MSLPNPVVCLLNNMLNKSPYNEHNMIDQRDMPKSITFRFDDGGFVNDNCAVSHLLQGPRKIRVSADLSYENPVTGRLNYKFYKLNETGEWVNSL